MSFNLFQLVPAVYRLQDAQIAQSMQLLTAASKRIERATSAAATLSPINRRSLMPSQPKPAAGHSSLC